MTKSARRAEMLEYIRNARVVTCDELSSHYGVTLETVRKDLTAICESGEIIRTFGGAALRENNDEISMEQRKILNYAKKQKIAREAKKLISSGEPIVMDAGSTIAVLAQELDESLQIVVTTNSLETVNILTNKKNITIVSTGGNYRRKSMSFQGEHAEQAINSHIFSKAFITCAGVDAERGIMDTNEEEVRIKNSMIKNAQEVYLLADSTKINKIAYVATCAWANITAMITDDGISSRDVKLFEEKGIRVIVSK